MGSGEVKVVHGCGGDSWVARSTRVGWGPVVGRRQACWDMMSRGRRAEVGRLLLVPVAGGRGEGASGGEGVVVVAEEVADRACSARSGNGSVVSASACFDARLAARMVSLDARDGASPTVGEVLGLTASASRGVLVDGPDDGLVKAVLSRDHMAEAFLRAMMDSPEWEC